MNTRRPVSAFPKPSGNWEADSWPTYKTVTCSEMVYEDGSGTQDGFSDSWWTDESSRSGNPAEESVLEKSDDRK